MDNNYQDDLGDQLWTDDTYKDFKIFVENQEFQVHRCILSARSPVLDRMLSLEMIENITGEMTIVDFSPAVIEEAISFFYKGEISSESCSDGIMLVDLLYFANKYDVESLISYCMHCIEKNKSTFDSSMTLEMITSIAELDTDSILDKILSIFGTIGFVDLPAPALSLPFGLNHTRSTSWSLSTYNQSPDNYTIVFGFPSILPPPTPAPLSIEPGQALFGEPPTSDEDEDLDEDLDLDLDQVLDHDMDLDMDHFDIDFLANFEQF